MTTSDYSPSGVRVSLHNADLWNKFYPMNEMVVSKPGRKLFPDLNVNIEGLIPNALYTVFLFLERIDDYKYKFSKATGQWEETGKSDRILTVDKKQHKDGGMVGAHWMKSPVSFSNFRITHDSDDMKKSHSDNLILVSSMHKYQPVITVRRLIDGMEEEFRLTMTEFIVVTSYQDRKIVELKKASNKYSSRFIDVPSRGKKRAITSDPSPTVPPTGPASLSINTVTWPVGSPISSLAKKTAPPNPVPLHHQNQMKTSPATSSSPVVPTPITSPTPPAMVPPYMGLNNFQNPIIMTPIFIVASPGQNFALNQNWNPYGMWNTHQIGGGAPVPQPTQWNMIQGAAQLGQPDFPQFNGAGPSS
ncbi:unnamed protein product [Caenorhabditis brenneri]